MAESTQQNSLQRVDAGLAQGDGDQAGNPVMQLVARGRVAYEALPPAKRHKLLALVLMGAGLLAAFAWYSNRTEWKTLFTGLDTKDVQQLSQTLSASGVDYQLTPDGSGVQVPSTSLDKARMEVAAKGMPQTGRLGFEIFDKPNWVGSEFDEKVNYQRALEGELEHTIGTLSAVRSARVHLSLPEKSLFSAQDSAAKASVVLKLRRQSMPAEQIDSIRSLVAGAVDSLAPGQVTLVDADGVVNFKQRTGDALAQDAERAMEERLVAMLEPLAGRDNVRATVNITRDESSLERTDEVYDPTQTAPVTMQRSEQTATARQPAVGVPGTTSNTPAASAAGTAQGATQAAAVASTSPSPSGLPVFPVGGGGGQNSREESNQYAVSKHTTHREDMPGRIQRVTAAILVNDRMVSEGAGNAAHTVWKQRSPDEMKRLTELAQAAVGFDGQRSDQVVLQNVSFQSNVPEVPVTGIHRLTDEAETLLRNEPMLAKSAGMAVVGTLLVFFVLRPIVEHTGAALRAPARLAPPIEAPVFAPPALEEPPARPEPTLANQTNRAVFEQVAAQIRREPKQATHLIESWIGSDESEGQ